MTDTAQPVDDATTTRTGGGGGVEHETRFAVVLYGGVSLAVYITGVCLELLNMVRATATTTASGQPERRLEGSQIAYRLAGSLVGGSDDDGTITAEGIEELQLLSSILTPYLEAGDQATISDQAAISDEERTRVLAEAASTLVPRRRFVVDVLSGSSAGGLNAIYLSKALTHDQSIDHLKKLWVDDGGLGEILNDDVAAQHYTKTALTTLTVDTSKAGSLLSGDLMLLKLFDALDAMDRSNGTEVAGGQPLVDALDCYLTTTDLRGLLLPVRLGPDRFITENRHRSVFHLAFGTPIASGGYCNHLHQDYNPYLAFIARATSAHPAAFEPAQLKALFDRVRPGSDLNQEFIARRISPRLVFSEPGWTKEMPNRWYSDGGDMDNKPFTYVLDPLRNRRASVPVDRQLLYVEPDPDALLHGSGEAEPTFGETSFGAYSLGRTENIREDIERVLDRNSTVRRLRRGFEDQVGVLAQRIAHRRVEAATQSDEPVDPVTDAGYGAQAEVSGHQARPPGRRSARHSLSPGPDEVDLAYELHKTVWVGGELGSLLARVAGFATDSAQTRWIVDMCQLYAQQGDRAIELLPAIDLGYRLRRLMFVDKVLQRLQEARQEGELDTVCKRWHLDPDDTSFDTVRSVREALNEIDVDLRCIGRHLRSNTPERAYGDRRPVWNLDPRWRERWGDDAATADVDESLRFAMGSTVLQEWQSELVEWNDHLLSLTRQVEASSYSKPTSDDIDHLDTIVEEVGAILQPWFQAASKKSMLAIDGALAGEPSLRRLLISVYDAYHRFDQFVLPSWSEARGELDEAEITRVSPLDATSLMTVSKVKDHEVNKLAGNSLGHFGGFVDADWRRNDILWGRLDAAEILLHRLLPQPHFRTIRDDLVTVAHDRILAEEWETVKLLPDLSQTTAETEIPDEADPVAARTFLQNDFNASLDPRGRIGPELVGRMLDVAGRMAKHHGVDVAGRLGRSKVLGRTFALLVRVLRLGLPAGGAGLRRVYILAQRLAYAVTLVLGAIAVVVAFTGGHPQAAAWGLAACGSAAGALVLNFQSASVGESSRGSVLRTVLLGVPFAALARAYSLNSDATFAAVAGFSVLMLVLLLAGPSLYIAISAYQRIFRLRGGSTKPGQEVTYPNRLLTLRWPEQRMDLFNQLTKLEFLLGDLGQVLELASADGSLERTRVRLKLSEQGGVGREGHATSCDIEFLEVVWGRRIAFRWSIDDRGQTDDGWSPPRQGTVSLQLRDEAGVKDWTATLVHVRSTFATHPDDVPPPLAAMWPDHIASVVRGQVIADSATVTMWRRVRASMKRARWRVTS